MTFNTQHCLNFRTRHIDFDVMEQAIRSCGADIVGLNEMRGKGEDPDYTDQVDILGERMGYHHYFAKAIDFRGANPYGNGLISRYPILNAETILVPDPDSRKYDGYYETRCLLKAVIDVDGGPLNVLVIHFGLNPDEQENAVRTILENLPGDRTILMGDFNAYPDETVLDPIRARLKDCADMLTPLKGDGDVSHLSFPSDAPDCKIDYIFVSPDIEVLNAEIPAIVASDHRPHTAEISI